MIILIQFKEDLKLEIMAKKMNIIYLIYLFNLPKDIILKKSLEQRKFLYPIILDRFLIVMVLRKSWSNKNILFLGIQIIKIHVRLIQCWRNFSIKLLLYPYLFLLINNKLNKINLICNTYIKMLLPIIFKPLIL